MSGEDTAANVALARHGLERWIAGDREGAIATFSDDVVVYVPAELGNAGTFRGVEQFESWYRSWYDAWSDFEMTVHEIEPVGERHVVAMINSRGTGAGSGVEVENTLGWVLGVRDGKLEYLALLPDRDSARQHALERESA